MSPSTTLKRAVAAGDISAKKPAANPSSLAVDFGGPAQGVA